MNAIIIRFEGPLAVCRRESRTLLDIKRFLLPEEAEEGDVLEIIGNKISINASETRKNKKRLEALIEDIL